MTDSAPGRSPGSGGSTGGGAALAAVRLQAWSPPGLLLSRAFFYTHSAGAC